MSARNLMRVTGWWPAVAVARPARRLQALSGHPSMDSWERLCLARRKLDLAVREEDYVTAAEAKAEVDMLRERLPANKLLLASLLDKLDPQQLAPDRERRTAIQQLGDLGDMAAVPSLTDCLHDSNPTMSEAAEEALWSIFMQCPTPELELKMQQGVILMQRPEQWEAALQLFTELTSKAPTFAEGYNKRATVLYLMQRYHAAIGDCHVALQMNPFHFAAANGLGMCCGAVGDARGAVAAFEHAVALNPRLSHLRQHIMQLKQMLQQQEEKQQSNE